MLEMCRLYKLELWNKPLNFLWWKKNHT
jgi:hypothetical protein